MFNIKRKSGTVYDTKRPAGLGPEKTFLDVPFCGSVCLVDDTEKLIVSSVDGYYPFNYKIEAYPESHHME